MNLPIGSGAGILQIVPGVTPRYGVWQRHRYQPLSRPTAVRSRDRWRNAESAAIHAYWMEEAQIAGLGANAEHGEFSAVVANIALRSGSHRTSGLLEYRISPTAGSATTPAAFRSRVRSRFIRMKSCPAGTRACRSADRSRKRLFFSRAFITAPPGARGGNGRAVGRAVAGFSDEAHVGAQPHAQVGGFVEADRTHAFGRLALNAQPEAANDQTTNMRSWNAQATWIPSSRPCVKFQGGGVKYDFTGIPESRRAGPPPRSDIVTGVNSGNVQQFQDLVQSAACCARQPDAVSGWRRGSQPYAGGRSRDRARHAPPVDRTARRSAVHRP